MKTHLKCMSLQVFAVLHILDNSLTTVTLLAISPGIWETVSELLALDLIWWFCPLHIFSFFFSFSSAISCTWRRRQDECFLLHKFSIVLPPSENACLLNG
ncbi:hypothetical protein VPH35_138023 [Triticum aestivum]|uniref:Uncharacterized protein n=1 Tax=Aegilops tauschii subsp. strangulata TaxID=200361 RepID=A0A453S4P7_AEGTS